MFRGSAPDTYPPCTASLHRVGLHGDGTWRVADTALQTPRSGQTQIRYQLQSEGVVWAGLF